MPRPVREPCPRGIRVGKRSVRSVALSHLAHYARYRRARAHPTRNGAPRAGRVPPGNDDHEKLPSGTSGTTSCNRPFGVCVSPRRLPWRRGEVPRLALRIPWRTMREVHGSVRGFRKASETWCAESSSCRLKFQNEGPAPSKNNVAGWYRSTQMAFGRTTNEGCGQSGAIRPGKWVPRHYTGVCNTTFLAADSTPLASHQRIPTAHTRVARDLSDSVRLVGSRASNKKTMVE